MFRWYNEVDNLSISFVLPGKSEHQEKLDAALKVCITLKLEKRIHKFPQLLYVGKYYNRYWRNCWVQFVCLVPHPLVGTLSFFWTCYAPHRHLHHHFLLCLLECPCNHFMLEVCESVRSVVIFVLILKSTATATSFSKCDKLLCTHDS